LENRFENENSGPKSVTPNSKCVTYVLNHECYPCPDCAFKCQMKNAQCSTLNESLISHAIRRWRSYQPRRHHDPEPSNSWIDQCPCGVNLPCEKHRDLWRRIRYLKPSDPDFVAHLQAGIPHYIPTTDELARPQPPERS
jgi:hypothetical protein